MRIGIYGKGGIGKSTISANLSAAFAVTGASVLQIGCDPKRDSTRLLLEGCRVVTVLDYLRDTPPAAQRGEDVVHVGYRGVHCVEAGGPEPGVGCAGRGILSAFALLERLRIDWAGYDVTLFDVLGDVVCGGFAVPLRKGFAESILVVTSEELMSLYAANNILRGVCNMDQGEERGIGLVLNRRDRDNDAVIVRRFAEAVGVEVVAELPRSELFRRSEARGQTLAEAFPGSDEARIFQSLTGAVLKLPTGLPTPLDDAALEDLVLGWSRSAGHPAARRPAAELPSAGRPAEGATPAPVSYGRGSPTGRVRPRSVAASVPASTGDDASASAGGEPSPDRAAVHALDAATTARAPSAARSHRYVSKSLLAREPLHGCAFAGAVATLTQIRDAVTVAHGPRSCTHIVASSLLSAGLGSQARYGIDVPEELAPAVVATDLSEHAMIHGGLDELRATIARSRAGAQAVFVVTTCPAGVIGDDVDRVIRDECGGGEPRSQEPEGDQAICDECGGEESSSRTCGGDEAGGGAPILRVTTDGNLEGDYLQGIINACMEGAGALIDPDCAPDEDCVNVIAEKNIALNADANLEVVRALLADIGVRIACRFVRRTSVAELRGFLRAPLVLPASCDHLGRVLMDYLDERFGCAFARHPFPSGFHETERWLRDIAAFFDRSEAAERVLERCRAEYEAAMAAVRPSLSGTRLMITTYNHDVDWLLETAFDAGMEVVRVGIMDYSQDGLHRTRYADRVTAEVDYDPDRRAEDIIELRPDLVLANYQSPGLPDSAHYDTVPMCPDVGHLGGALLAERWARLLKAPRVEGWRRDESRLLRS